VVCTSALIAVANTRASRPVELASLLLAALSLSALACCAPSRVETVQAFREAQERAITTPHAATLSADRAFWYEERRGPGEPWVAGRRTFGVHWDEYFRGESTAESWHV